MSATGVPLRRSSRWRGERTNSANRKRTEGFNSRRVYRGSRRRACVSWVSRAISSTDTWSCINLACPRVRVYTLEWAGVKDLMRGFANKAVTTGSVLLCLVVASNRGSEGRAQEAPAAPAPANSKRALIDQYCLGCHSDRLKSGGLALSSLNLDAPGNDAQSAEIAEKVIRKLRGGLMPPAGARRPDRPVRGRLRLVARERNRHPGGAASRARGTAPPQPPGVRVRHPRPARAQHRRDRMAARRQRQGQLRQQRRRPAGVAQLHRPVHVRRARRRARGDRQPEGARRDDHLRRRRQHGDLSAAVRRTGHRQAAASPGRDAASARAAASASNTISRRTATTSSRSATWRSRAKCRGWNSRTR